MKLSQVLNADIRQDGVEEELQKWLLKIPAIRKQTKDGEKVSFELIEKLIIKLCQKYGISMQWITLSMIDPNGNKKEVPWYSIPFKTSTDHKWVKTVYGITMYETFCKAALFLYAYTRKGE